MTDSPRYPSRFPLFRLLALALSIAAFVWFLSLWRTQAPVVQRHDLFSFVRTTLPPIPFLKTYTVVMDRQHLADASSGGPLYLQRIKADPLKLHAFLRENVYDDQLLWSVLRWPLAGFGVCLIALLMIGARLDNAQNSQARDGRILRGPRIVSRRKWNSFVKRRSRSLYVETADGELWIAEEKITQHGQVVGCTGTGKSTILRGVAYQLLQRGPGIFVDLACEYVREFYQPGDWVLNFSDERCPRWLIGQEAEDEPHAIAIADGAYPSEPGDQFFFMDHARAILAFLLGRFHPTTTELAQWIANPLELDKRVKGTEHASSLTHNSPEQRAGVIATMARLARSLRWMPDEPGRREFTVKEWAKTRKGSIFLTSDPDTFSALRPMQSMILDLVLLKMQTTPGPGFILGDEAGQLQKLPQLERAMSMQRKAGNPIWLGYQGFSQLEMHYGEKAAESIVSAPATSIILRTEGKRSAEWSSAILGMPAEVERIREGRSLGNLFFHRPHRNLQSERVMLSAVLPGEVQSLPNLEGYISSEGRIARLKARYRPPVVRAPRLIERIIKPALIEPESEPLPRPSRYSKPKQLPLAKIAGD